MPGFLTAVALMIQCLLLGAGSGTCRATRARASASSGPRSARASLALVTPVIIMGGIFGGIFTPTEAAAVAALYSLVLGLFIYRDDVAGATCRGSSRNAVNTSAVVGFIVAGASLFGWVLAREQVPQQVAAAFLASPTTPW